MFDGGNAVGGDDDVVALCSTGADFFDALDLHDLFDGWGFVGVVGVVGGRYPWFPFVGFGVDGCSGGSAVHYPFGHGFPLSLNCNVFRFGASKIAIFFRFVGWFWLFGVCWCLGWLFHMLWIL